MNILSLTDVSKSVNDVVLFRDVTLGIEEGEKIGFVGRNGSGKTTFLRILSGSLAPDDGTVARRNGLTIASVEQRPSIDGAATIDDFLHAGDAPLIRLLGEYKHALAQAAEGKLDEKRLADLTHRMEESNAFSAEERFQSVCRELGIVDTSAKMTALSGGMVRKASLARALIAGVDLLLLDEPTNHLDIDTIEWLEQNLHDARFAFLMVTHDRYFLDSVCDSIIEIDGSNMYKYKGSYADYLERKAEREAFAARAEEKRIAVLRSELEWLKRGPRARTGKDKTRKARAEELIEGRPADEERMSGFSSSHRRLGKKVLELDSVSKSFGEGAVIDTFSYEFRRGERVGIIGPNGSGKTTLLELIAGRLSPDSGSIARGDNTTFGYLDQTAQRVDASATVLDFVRSHAERIQMTDGTTVSAEQFLERFLFPRSMLGSTLERLSGGELRRLSLIRLLAAAPNFLLLDEPTNDLDVDTIRLLEEYLTEFDGCVLLVSHDRALLDRLTEYLFVFEGAGRVRKFVGNYAEYREQARSDRAKQDRTTGKTNQTAAKQPPRVSGKQFGNNGSSKKQKPSVLSFKEQKEYESIMEEIEALEIEKGEIERFFSTATGDHALRECNNRRYAELTAELEAKITRWEELAARSDNA